MAKKSGSRLVHKESGTQSKNSDEITLRDEILELKRQVMILKRTNEQYSVKLRKYEDEAKRKDKQLEQLMDPRKNSDITKVLSTKGAAILMNLKDQNNTLIQMILNKDLHIRRLMAEIKMSKLYASTKKNESYRAEISRLRNLLIKSQETLKENVEFHEQSICVSGNSFLEFFSSSDESSPRDLDELRLTILNLESHIQQSNDLITKKNQEISLLRDELNFLKKISHNKTFKNKSCNCKKDCEFLTPVSSSRQPDIFMPPKILSQDILFQKNTSQEDEKLPIPVQDVSKKRTTSIDSIPKYNLQSCASEETTEPIEINQENIESVQKACIITGKSLFNHLAAHEIKREEKILSNFKSTVHAKEKWKKALSKYKELKQLNPQMFTRCVQVEEVYLKYKKKENESSEDEDELQKSIKITQNNHLLEKDRNTEDKLNKSNPPELFIEGETENIPKTPASSHTVIYDNEASEKCQSSGNESWVFKNENYKAENRVLAEKTCFGDVAGLEPQSPRDSQKAKKVNIIQNSSTNEKTEPKYAEPFRENYFHSLYSSSDSEIGYSVQQEAQQVQVEVQINSISSESDNDQSGNNISETNQFYEYDRENNGNLPSELEFDDDDDVITREK